MEAKYNFTSQSSLCVGTKNNRMAASILSAADHGKIQQDIMQPT